jgi:hypothetical protein
LSQSRVTTKPSRALLLVNDRPFSTSGFEIGPDSLLGQIVID